MLPRLFAFLVIAIAIWLLFRSRYPIRVTISDRGIEHGTRLSPVISKRLSEFAEENLLPGEQIQVRGQVVSGHIRWVMPRSTNPSLVQRLRNYMYTEVS